MGKHSVEGSGRDRREVQGRGGPMEQFKTQLSEEEVCAEYEPKEQV